jgi:hypothetical protein
MTTEPNIDGIQYRTGQLNAKLQFHVARRLAPVIASISALATDGQAAPAPLNGTGEDMAATGQPDNAKFFAVLADAIRALPDTDCDYVLSTCMSVVMRRQGDHWIPVWNKASDQPQFADITLNVLMQLTFAVIQDNLGGFMPAPLPSGSPTSTTILNGR